MRRDLLEPAAFAGTIHATHGPRTGFVGQSRFDGYVVIASWRRADVAALLPPEISLAPRIDSADDQHPVVTLFGTQADGVIRFAGVAWPGGPAYQEAALAIPFVTRREGHALHLYMARMYASYPPAVWAGNLYYGFSKTLASVAWDGRRCSVLGRDSQMLLDATVDPHEIAAPAVFEPIRQLFLLPVLGRRWDRSLRCSRFDWNVRGATIRRATAGVTIGPAMPEGPAVEAQTATAFSIRGLQWQLSWPGECAS